jgi:transposase
VIQIDLTTEEKEMLQEYFKTSPISLIRLKAQAILMRDHEMKVEEIAYAVVRDERTIERWITDFSKKRLGSIFSGMVDNDHASKLTKGQKEEIKKVLNQKPSDYGLPKEFWDVPQLKRYVYARFGTVYETDRSYHFLLEFGNLSFKVPDKFNVRRNEQKIAVRMEQIYEEILPFMEDPSWEVFCSDESRMQLEAITRRAWLRKGEKTVIRVERSDDYQNYLGFLNQKTFQCHIFEIAWGNLEEVIKATGEFIKLYPNKKICIIWDNATCHKGILMRQALAKGGLLERVHLVWLPPYAPDHNPIEHVWNTIKDKLSNKQDYSFQQTKNKFMTLTNNQFFPYQI